MNLEPLADPLSAAIVLGGTVIATMLRSGREELSAALGAVIQLVAPRFKYRSARAEIAHQIDEIRHDGLLRASPCRSSDEEIAYATRMLVHDRSVASLLAAHDRYRREREDRRDAALRPLMLAGELAPVFGMVGTLVSLALLAKTGIEGAGLMPTVGMAVVTTLYGLLLAHLVFFPLARMIERHGEQDEAERQKLFDWLSSQLANPSPAAPPILERAA